MSENEDRQIRGVLKRARDPLRPEVRDRALAAVAATRPRRYSRLVTIIIVAALILLLAAGLFAAVRYFFIEGTLHFHSISVSRSGRWYSWDQTPSGHFLSGELEWETDQRPSHAGDISAVSGKVVFSREDAWPPTLSDILVSNPDWSDEVNLTEIAGIGGVNCYPRWSPDGSMIAFQHYDPVEGVYPCDGFHVWVMNADGTDAHRVMPGISLPHWKPTWSPDGSRLLIYMYDYLPDAEGVAAINTDIRGRDTQVVPNVGWDCSWSPDGSMIISVQKEVDRAGGALGRWIRLLLTNADGTDPKVLVEQFVANEDCRDHLPDEAAFAGYQEIDWTEGIQTWAGPLQPVWSPDGDKIAFLAALPFDPDGLFIMNQVEVWVYDLTTDELIRVTDDDVGQISIIWK